MAAGEVLLTGPQLGTPGTSGNTLANLSDANQITAWNVYPTPAGWAGVDAGAACALTRVRLTALPPNSDCSIGCTIEGSASSAFNDGLAVQGLGTFTNASGQASIALAFSGAQTAGNTNVILVSHGTAGSLVTGITDTSLNTYTQLIAGNSQDIWIASNIASASAGANTVTAHFSPTTGFPTLEILEYNGIVNASPLDGSSSSTGTSTTPNSGPLTVSSPNAVIIAFVSSGAGTISQGSGAQMLVNQSPTWGGASEAQEVRATGTYSIGFSLSASSNWFCTAVGLKLSVPPPSVFFTITNRPGPGILTNEYPINTLGSTFRYYRYNSKNGPANNYGSVSDLDFIAQYISGITGASVDPTITPTGRHFDLPIVVTLSSLTTDASIYYTKDGSTPTSASTLYTGPFVLSASCTFKCIAISPGLTNSRVVSTVFNIPHAIVSNSVRYDDRNYHIESTSVSPDIFLDPVSGYWYMYGNDLDGPGVTQFGQVYDTIYRSADLVNWKYIGNFGSPPGVLVNNYLDYMGRTRMIYSQANGYVMWAQNNIGNRVIYFTSSSPEGPFTLAGGYTSFNGVAVESNLCLFLDDDGVSAYLCYVALVGANVVFLKLNNSWTNWDGVHFQQYDAPSTFGLVAPFVNNLMDGPHMFKAGLTYFFTGNAQNGWAPTENTYATASSPLGPWTNQGNFAQVNAGAPGPNTLFYNGQANYVFKIPGRNVLVMTIDAYNTGLAGNVNSDPTANFQGERVYWLPVSVSAPGTGGTGGDLRLMSINWVSSWNMDSMFPTQFGQPLPPTGFSISLCDPKARWTNIEPKAHVLYLDYATDSVFTQNVRSEIIGTGPGASQPTVYTPILPVVVGYYRIRAVNANGTTPSQFALIPPPLIVIGGTGYYGVLTLYGGYDVLYLSSNVDYSSSLNRMLTARFPDYWSCMMNLIATLGSVGAHI